MVKVVVEGQTYYKWWETIDVNVTGYYKIWRLVIHSKVAIAVGVKVCSFPWSATDKSWLLYCSCCAQQMYAGQAAIGTRQVKPEEGTAWDPYVSERTLHRDRNPEEGAAIDLSAITLSIQCCSRPLRLKLLIRS